MMARWVCAILATLPIAASAFLIASEWRLFDGRWAIVGWILFGFGALFVGVNFYTSLLRYPLHRLRGGTSEDFRWVSGTPLLGVLVVPGVALLPASSTMGVTGLALVLLDFGGLHWFAIAVWREGSVPSEASSGATNGEDA